MREIKLNAYFLSEHLIWSNQIISVNQTCPEVKS